MICHKKKTNEGLFTRFRTRKNAIEQKNHSIKKHKTGKTREAIFDKVVVYDKYVNRRLAFRVKGEG